MRSIPIPQIIIGIARRYPVTCVIKLAKGSNKKEFAAIMMFVRSFNALSACSSNFSRDSTSFGWVMLSFVN